ncbi:MAG: transglutaminase [Caulobacterales bacterium 68-7]|nr:MAG: transglutaminase [Caulobacterales bacterium 68-7]
MKIRAGYRITFDSVAPTPINLLLSVHPERRGDLLTPDVCTPYVDSGAACPTETIVDPFGNLITRVLVPRGPVTFTSDFLIADSGLIEPAFPDAGQMAVETLPGDTLQFLLPSRYCETDELSDLAWSLFGGVAPGWARVEAIVDWTHKRLAYDYKRASATRTARLCHEQETGVCRDYAHLAIALCRCLNIPARYCTGYLGDIGVPALPTPMDFHAWFEAFLDAPGQGGGWHAFDARHNARRIGRILMARGRDAADVAISTTFGTTFLTEFSVTTEEIGDDAMRYAAE